MKSSFLFALGVALSLFRSSSACKWAATPDATLARLAREQLKQVSVEDCQRACCKRTWCSSFDYDKKNKMCNLFEESELTVRMKTDFDGNFDHYSKVASQALRGLKYQGCFIEDPEKRVLARAMGTTDNVEECHARCALEGYSTSAVQADHQCFCGGNVRSLDRAPFDCSCSEVDQERLARASGVVSKARRRNQRDDAVCVYAEGCCKEDTAACAACRMQISEATFCKMSGIGVEGCAELCSIYPEISGCKGGICYRNERVYDFRSECPKGTRFVRWNPQWFANDQVVCEEEYACEVEESKEMCSYSDAETSAVWSFRYFTQWGHFPNKEQQKAFEELLRSDQMKKIDAALEVMFEDMDPETRSQLDEAFNKDDIWKQAVALGGKSAGYYALGKLAVTMAARQVALAAAELATAPNANYGLVMFRYAMAQFWEGAGEAYYYNRAAQVGKLAYTGLFIGVVVSDWVARITAGLVMDYFGLENRQIIAAAGLAASVAAGAAIGWIIGPIGSVGGAAAGTGFWVVSETIMAVFRVGQGPSWNWAYLETGYLGHKTQERAYFYSYNKSDQLYLIAYDRKYLADNEDKVISAGNDVDEFFQVEVETDASNAAHFNEVWHRDLIRVAKSAANQICTLHCRGDKWEKTGGLCVKKFATLI